MSGILAAIRRLFSRAKDPDKKYPYLARLSQHPIRCRTCDTPLLHGDEVVFFRPDLLQSSDISYARCVAFTRHEDGTIEIDR